MDQASGCSEIGVLLVDDEASFRMSLADMLRDDGHVVWDYGTPADIPRQGSEGTVTVVISDYDMPGMTGIALADELHARHREVPVVIVTAYRTRSIEAQVAGRPFMRLVDKPIDYEVLHALLHEIGSAGPTRSPGSRRSCHRDC
ncbi:MAG: response regulator [Deltaproteobacteria bacterium]|nr:response regulator [Deltaproteobacteria bacterium]